jgi:Fn3-like domain from Purple Acid Phosphatase
MRQLTASLLAILYSLPLGCVSMSRVENFRRIELQTIEVDHRGDHIVNEFQLINHEALDTRKTNKHNITSVSPLVISNNGIVLVKYSATKPEEADWIGAYSPANADISKTVPVKFALCKTDPNYLTTGIGKLNFNFTNLRDDVAFHYFTGSLVSPVLAGTYEKTLSFKNVNEPLRPRIVPVGSKNTDTFKLLWSR